MTLEIDPDLRLHARLALGRGWRRATTIALWIAGLGLLATGRYRLVPFFLNEIDATPDPGFLQIALLLLIIAPPRAVARLLDLERGGLLDQTRLCGRRPHRVLVAFLLGSTGPFVMLAAALLINHMRLVGQPAVILLAILVFAAALGVSLLAYGALPPTMSADSRFLTPLLYLFGFVAFLALRMPLWVQRLAFDEPAARLTGGVVAAVLPVGLFVAYRRVKRPRQAAGRFDGVSLPGLLSRLVPRAGPPEFNRQLRSGLLSGGTMVSMIAGPLVAMLGIRISQTVAFWAYSPAFLNGIPFALIFLGAFASSMTVRREIESATIDGVRLTPQVPLAIILSWYIALALPFWIAALATAMTLRFSAATVFQLQRPLLAVALMLPAVSLAEGFQRRRPGTYLWMPILLAAFVTAFALIQSPVPRNMEFSLMRQGLDATERQVILTRHARTLPGGEWRRVGDAERPQQVFLLATLATVLALGVGAGRLRRPDGPALAGAAAVLGVCAVVFAVRHLPLMVFPRVLPGVLAILASFLAEEREISTSPWMRVATAGGAAVAGVVFATRLAGISWTGTLITAVAGGLAIGAGLLVHELLWRTPPLSLGLRLIVLLGLERWSWSMMSDLAPERISQSWLEVSPALGTADVGALAALFLVAAFVHARRRSQAFAPITAPATAPAAIRQ